MSSAAFTITSVGLVTSIGLSARDTCAAIRAKVANPVETRFTDSRGQWIVGHQVVLDEGWRDLRKLAKMAALSIDEALQGVPAEQWSTIPLLLCVAEAERPGRIAGLDTDLFPMIQAELGVQFSPRSSAIAHGRVSVGVAMHHARRLMTEFGVQRVLIAATDSLLTWPTLSSLDASGRLLTERNANGFIPGEAAGALLLSDASSSVAGLHCVGIGFGREPAFLNSGEPQRADGLTSAFKAALDEAACGIQELDFRITDLAGEHYYFKEAALAVSRTLRVRKEEFDIWHPAECIGEVGAAAGAAIIALADTACRKHYAKGPRILAHMGNDAGARTALVLQYRAQA